MKIIDLLNRISNGEEVPKKIKWENTIFVYSDYDKDYLEFPFSEEEYQGLFCMKNSILTQYLNDEVEIIKENKKIEEIPYNFSLDFVKSNLTDEEKKGIDEAINLVYEKINEIIDKINEMENK